MKRQERRSDDAAAVPPRTRHARHLFSGISNNYDLIAEVLSFGQNGRWRRAMVERVRAGLALAPSTAPRVLDVATGPAAVAIDLVRCSDAHVVAIDQSPQMMGAGVSKVRADGLDGRIRFVLGQGERLPFADGSFDAVTFTYLLRYVDDPARTLSELTRVLRPGGTLGNLEFAVPAGTIRRGLWLLYTRTVLPLAGRLISRPWYEVGKFLGPSISTFYRRFPLDRQLAMWRVAGISDVRARTMSLGGGVVIWGTKRVAKASVNG
jgi:demethylmenaquinone methyltransferase/2-methoxy-6-polyprenyl-1,4-benzoquinol methylase